MLPITGLATGVKRQEDFLGIHFLAGRQESLVDHQGEKIGRGSGPRSTTPWPSARPRIVVNDSRGFFSLRVIGAFVNEALAMLGEGVEPVGGGRRSVSGRRRCSCPTSSTLMYKTAVATRKGVEDAAARTSCIRRRPGGEDDRAGRLKGAASTSTDGKRFGLWLGFSVDVRRVMRRRCRT